MLLQILSQILENAQINFAVCIGLLSFAALWLCEVSE